MEKIGEVLGLAKDEDIVAAGGQLLLKERRSNPASFDLVWTQQVGDAVPEWLRQES